MHGANTNQAVAFIRLRNKRSHFPLCWLALRSCETQNFIASKVVQAVQANASLANIGDIPVTLPGDDIIGRFNLLAFPLIREYRALQSETRALASARDILLPKLLSGELSVEALAEQAGTA
jgi:type I restriction enzyme S subunit